MKIWLFLLMIVDSGILQKVVLEIGATNTSRKTGSMEAVVVGEAEYPIFPSPQESRNLFSS